MRFDNDVKLVAHQDATLENCKIEGGAWDNFGLIYYQGQLHEDFAYCRDCYTPYKIHDKKGIYLIISITYTYS